MKRHLLLACLLSSSLMSLGGCRSEDTSLGKIGDSIQRSVSGAMQQATGAVSDLHPADMAQEEYSKLYAFEYHVETVFLPTTAPDLQIRLNELGKERWECSSPIVGLTERISVEGSKVEKPTNDRAPEPQAVIVCKRRPATYLRLVPRLAP